MDCVLTQSHLKSRQKLSGGRYFYAKGVYVAVDLPTDLAALSSIQLYVIEPSYHFLYITSTLKNLSDSNFGLRIFNLYNTQLQENYAYPQSENIICVKFLKKF